MYYFTSLWTLR